MIIGIINGIRIVIIINPHLSIYYHCITCPKLSFVVKEFERGISFAAFVIVITVVIFCIGFPFIVVASCCVPKLLAVNPAGNEDVFTNVPLEVYTFITAFIV
jgi:uncharacterized membrane protein (DUF485 family)